MSENGDQGADFDDEMAEYLQTFLDETEEQLDDLVETMLSLEQASDNAEDLNEAFRLIHSIKGSAGMMGLDSITVLTHHLENRFERFRSGTEKLDEPTMNLVLRCIDFLRQCNERLRAGDRLSNPTELLEELRQLENSSQQQAATSTDETDQETAGQSESGELSAETQHPLDADDESVRITIRFRVGLQLADLKAQLIVKRLASLGELKSTLPDLDSLSEDEPLEGFQVWLETAEGEAQLRAAADVDGVDAIEILGAAASEEDESTSADQSPAPPEPAEQVPESPGQEPAQEPGQEPEQEPEVFAEQEPEIAAEQQPEELAPAEPSVPAATASEADEPAVRPAEPDESQKTPSKVAETMRVDIGRLDKLMNLTGELVVSRARFVQLSSQISPTSRKTTSLNRIREFCDGLRNTIDHLEETADPADDRRAIVQQLRGGLEMIDEQSQLWERERQQLEEFGEAIDQLSRVSSSLQKGVLDTRMVPVGPLFNRFKRVVRDLSKQRGKEVNLVIRGEKTELDKRMIDELGDPLVHLVRNSIDHGLEPTEARLAAGKPQLGTITLEATHSGNNVYVHVRDDGGGVNIGKIKAKIAERGLLSPPAIDELSDAQALEYIWDPGFSTAQEITDVSGRGVGMDAVRNRIRQLNGTIEVDSVPGEGTHFTVRLPLTLAIINCLLVKVRGVVFSMPIEDVREIVSVDLQQVIHAHGHDTIDVRDQYIPLVSMEDVFRWNEQAGEPDRLRRELMAESEAAQLDVVILQTAGKAMGIRVDQLLGSQDMVIKSLSDNFMDIRGLSGASILGDGSVCLMLDVGAVFQLATRSTVAGTKEATI